MEIILICYFERNISHFPMIVDEGIYVIAHNPAISQWIYHLYHGADPKQKASLHLWKYIPFSVTVYLSLCLYCVLGFCFCFEAVTTYCA